MSLISRGVISEFLVSLGGLPRIQPVFVNSGCVDMPNVLSDVWMACNVQGKKEFLQAAETLDISSTSAGDSSGSTGARQLVLQGVDDNWDAISEVVALNGLATVTTTKSFLRLNFADVLTCGTYGSTGVGANEGVITIESSSTSNLEGVIAFSGGVPMGRMANSHYSVANGKRAVLRNSIDISVNRQMSADIYLMLRMNGPDVSGAPFGAARVVAVMTSAEGMTNVSVNTPPALNERVDVWFAAIPAQNLTPIQVNYNLALATL